MDFIDLIPGLSAIALAIVSGAGGSALLELYYKPRRDRRRVAGLMLAEIALNTQLIRLQAEVRKYRPKEIPEDFEMSTIAFDAAADLLSELPPQLLARVVALYNRYAASNREVRLYADAFREWERLQTNDPQKARLANYMDVVIDTFNIGIDKAFEAGLDLRDPLTKLAGLRRKPDPNAKPIDFDERVKRHLREKQARLDAIRKPRSPRKRRRQ